MNSGSGFHRCCTFSLYFCWGGMISVDLKFKFLYRFNYHHKCLETANCWGADLIWDSMNICTIKMSLWYSNVYCTLGGKRQKFMLLASVGNLCSFISLLQDTTRHCFMVLISCLLGWVDFALFLNFMKSHGFAVPLGKIWRTTKFFDFGLKPVRATPFKGTVSPDYWPLFIAYNIWPGPHMNRQNGFANFLTFTKIFVKNVCPRSQRLLRHYVSIVNN